jgi:predicted metal-dependent hydrolase
MEPRNIRFATDSEVPRHWHGGKIAVTNFLNNLSVFFPAGERFFVASVNHYRDRIPENDDIAAFCAQEGFHSREHVRYNRMLEAQGYPAVALEKRIERVLRGVTRITTPRFRLAATVALEHLTATLAHGLLTEPALLEGAHPTMASLWTWHAVEETEHKAVAFDVYQQVGGTWFERVRAMLYATVIFWALVFEQQIRLMRVDGVLFSPREWWSLFKFNFISPGALRKVMPLYMQYFRRDFHPWQHDNRELVEEWKAANAA